LKTKEGLGNFFCVDNNPNNKFTGSPPTTHCRWVLVVVAVVFVVVVVIVVIVVFVVSVVGTSLSLSLS